MAKDKAEMHQDQFASVSQQEVEIIDEVKLKGDHIKDSLPNGIKPTGQMHPKVTCVGIAKTTIISHSFQEDYRGLKNGKC